MKKLSVIISAYNAEPYLDDLLDQLNTQVNKDVEVIVVDDGSTNPVQSDYKWCRIIRKENGGCASARNKGLEESEGEYVVFIDSDDMVADDYVDQVLEKIKEKPDVIEVSWKSLEGNKHNCKLNSESDRLTNNSMWCRILRKDFIGDNRFNEIKDSTEDEDFSRHIGLRDKDYSFKRAIISDYMYFYRDNLSNSKIKRFKKGLMKTKRVVYFYKHVAADRKDILESIIQDDKKNEVILLTDKCDIPELSRYCQILKPQHTWTHYLKGESYHNIEIITPPIKTDIVLYRKHMRVIGGIMTFTMNFVEYMSDKYDITIVTDELDEERKDFFNSKVRVVINKHNTTISCDTLIMLSIKDILPCNVLAKKVLRMCHTCKTKPSWNIPKDYDQLVFVSDTAKKSFKSEEGEVIHNLSVNKANEMLILVSATRLPASDKGDIEIRMRKLATMLNDAGIPYIWLNFSNGELVNAPKNFFNMGVTTDIQTYIKKASYVVALSDSEAWSYTVLESLTHNVPLICTAFPSAFEMGIKDGYNAHVVPFDMDFDVNKLLNIPKFKYEYDNEAIINQWQELLAAAPKPKGEYVAVKCIVSRYFDKELDRYVHNGDTWFTTFDRAMFLKDDKKFVEIM